MKVFLVRSFVIATLFLLGSLVASITEKNYLALSVYFIAVCVWTLTLGFRRALWIIIPFLLLVDTLWDGRIGEVFLTGFLLSVTTTYLAARIETQSQSLQMGVYSFVVAIFAVVTMELSMLWPQSLFTPTDFSFGGVAFVWQIGVTILLFFPISNGLQKVEEWLDTSFQEASKKIR